MPNSLHLRRSTSDGDEEGDENDDVVDDEAPELRADGGRPTKTWLRAVGLAGAAAVGVASGVRRARAASVTVCAIEGRIAGNQTISALGGGGGDAFSTANGTPFHLRLTVDGSRLEVATGSASLAGAGGGGTVENVARLGGLGINGGYVTALANNTGDTLQTSGTGAINIGVGIQNNTLTVTGGE